MAKTVRLAVTQYEMRSIDSFDEFAEQCEFHVKTAASYAADFVVFPELFSTQLLSTLSNCSPDEAMRALVDYTPIIRELFADYARNYGVNIVAGSHFNETDAGLLNTAYFFDRSGNLRTQDKIHITPNERRVWNVQGGSKVSVFETDKARIAICICYDIEFPELARALAQQGVEIIFVPFNTDQRPGYLRVRYCAQARCIENHVYVALSGCTGTLRNADNANVHYAESAILTPADLYFSDDATAGVCPPGPENILIRDVDLDLLQLNKESGAVQNLKDRRTDLYQILWSN